VAREDVDDGGMRLLLAANAGGSVAVSAVWERADDFGIEDAERILLSLRLVEWPPCGGPRPSEPVRAARRRGAGGRAPTARADPDGT
jgi:hypothetical protein